ncbi:MOS1T transposase, partial [Pseudoatta argentina]
MSIFVPNKVYLRGILLHYFIQKKSAAGAHRILVQTYNDNALSDTTCRDWFRRFKNNDFELEDKERSGAPKKFQDKELEQLLDEELGKILQVDESTVSKRLKGLGMIQKQGHWVPYELKPRDVERRFGTCELLLQRQKRKGFLIMASSKGKTRDRSRKKRATRRMLHSDTRSRVKSVRCKHANPLYQRQLYDSINIPQLVYQLLTIDKHNHDARYFPSSKHFETHCRKTQNSHERQRLSYEAVDHRNDSESVQMPEYTIESRPTSTDNLTEATDATNSSVPTSSANSSVSNVSMERNALANSLNSAKALFRKRSLVHLINNYIKAGVEEGKRQAKKYICKALSFGVRSGYLIPTDRQGNMLRVCPTLDTQSWNWRRADVESRQRRRIARRGKTSLTTIAERKAMRCGIPRDKFLYGNADNKQTASKRKTRNAAQNPAKSLNTQESNPRKSLCKSLHEKSKPKAFTRKNSKINNMINNKRRQHQKKDDENIKKSIKKHRMSFSAKYARNDREPVEESYKDVNKKDRNQYESNENNHKIEEQKSTSSQEDESRMEKRKTEANINNNRIDYDRRENRNFNDENNDRRSEKESVDHNMSDKTIKEMEF